MQNLAQDAYVAKLKLRHEQERQMQLLKQGKKVDLGASGPLTTNDKGLQVRRRSKPLQHIHRMVSTGLLGRWSSLLTCTTHPQMFTKVGHDAEEATEMHNHNVKKKTVRTMQES